MCTELEPVSVILLLACNPHVIVPMTNSPSHIEENIEGAIERLDFALELYYLHRIDPSA